MKDSELGADGWMTMVGWNSSPFPSEVQCDGARRRDSSCAVQDQHARSGKRLELKGSRLRDLEAAITTTWSLT